jgi:hypothetical protein
MPPWGGRSRAAGCSSQQAKQARSPREPEASKAAGYNSSTITQTYYENHIGGLAEGGTVLFPARERMTALERAGTRCEAPQNKNPVWVPQNKRRRGYVSYSMV